MYFIIMEPFLLQYDLSDAITNDTIDAKALGKLKGWNGYFHTHLSFVIDDVEKQAVQKRFSRKQGANADEHLLFKTSRQGARKPLHIKKMFHTYSR